jgi:hypothetical protein
MVLTTSQCAAKRELAQPPVMTTSLPIVKRRLKQPPMVLTTSQCAAKRELAQPPVMPTSLPTVKRRLKPTILSKPKMLPNHSKTSRVRATRPWPCARPQATHIC